MVTYSQMLNRANACAFLSAITPWSVTFPNSYIDSFVNPIPDVGVDYTKLGEFIPRRLTPSLFFEYRIHGQRCGMSFGDPRRGLMLEIGRCTIALTSDGALFSLNVHAFHAHDPKLQSGTLASSPMIRRACRS